MWQVSHVLGFCTGVYHEQREKGGKRQEEEEFVRRIEGEVGTSPGQSPSLPSSMLGSLNW